MRPMASPGKELRRAALLTHAMGPADQAWLLASLSPQRRDRLQALLHELRSLGIPADASLLQAEKADAHPPKPSAAQRLQQLSSDEVGWLAGRLRDEPPELTAMLLGQHDWSWQARLLERLDTARRQCVAGATTGRGLPLPEAALLEAVVRMLPAATAAPRPSTARRIWSRLLQARIGGVASA